MKSSDIRRSVKLLANPVSGTAFLSLFISLFIFSFISVLIFVPSIFKEVIIIVFFVTLFGLAYLEKRTVPVADYKFNSPIFQTALILTGAISLGFAIGLDTTQLEKRSGRYFAAITFFLMASSMASIVDSIKSDYVDDINDTSARAVKINNYISRMRKFIFVLFLITYIALPVVISFIMVLCFKKMIN